MAELFGVEVPAVSKHLANIFDTGELTKDATISILETVQNEGTVISKMETTAPDKESSYQTACYNLNAISVRANFAHSAYDEENYQTNFIAWTPLLL